MKELYDVSQSLTREQNFIAQYYNDSNPGIPAGARYISTLKQVIDQLSPALDKAALTYAKQEPYCSMLLPVLSKRNTNIEK